MVKAKKVKEKEEKLQAEMPKRGNRRSSKEVTIKEINKPNVSNQKGRRKVEDIDKDDELFEQDLSSSSSLKYDSDDSDASFEEKKPWVKTGNNDKNVTVTKTNTNIPGDTTSSNRISENSIPKKKREVEELNEPSEPTIPKKKRDLEEPDPLEIITQTTTSKNQESSVQDSTESLVIANSTAPLVTGAKVLPPPAGDWSRPKAVSNHPDMIRSSGPPPSISIEKVIPLTKKPESSSSSSSIQDYLLKDLNSLMELVYSTVDRTRTAPIETVDMFGSFLNKSNQESLDFLDRDEKGNVVIQPKIPIFPEDFAPGQKPSPLSWWGIVTPSEWVLRHHYPAPAQVQPEKVENRLQVPVMNTPRDHVVGRRPAPTGVDQRQLDRDRGATRHPWPSMSDPLPLIQDQGWNHPSHGYGGQGGYRTGGVPEWNRNTSDNRRK